MSSIDALSSSSLSQLSQLNSAITTANSPNSPMDKVMSSVADLFGMSTSDLKAAQQSGTTLAQLASQKGISEDTLNSTLTTALQANAPVGAPANTDYTQMANNIANGHGPGGGGHHGHHRMHSDGANQSSSGLNDLLSSLGVDPSELYNLLSSSSSSSGSTGDASTNTATPSTTGTASASTSSAASSTDFVTQLKTLLSQYGSKGNLYDTAL